MQPFERPERPGGELLAHVGGKTWRVTQHATCLRLSLEPTRLLSADCRLCASSRQPLCLREELSGSQISHARLPTLPSAAPNHFSTLPSMFSHRGRRRCRRSVLPYVSCILPYFETDKQPRICETRAWCYTGPRTFSTTEVVSTSTTWRAWRKAGPRSLTTTEAISTSKTSTT